MIALYPQRYTERKTKLLSHSMPLPWTLPNRNICMIYKCIIVSLHTCMQPKEWSFLFGEWLCKGFILSQSTIVIILSVLSSQLLGNLGSVIKHQVSKKICLMLFNSFNVLGLIGSAFPSLSFSKYPWWNSFLCGVSSGSPHYSRRVLNVRPSVLNIPKGV